jgi:transcriptional regulator with XRE-family HTH domain
MSTVDTSRIGATLRATRARLGWSRETLAHHSGVSWSAIAQIESGRRKDVRLTSLTALARALGVSVDYLIGAASASAPQLLEHRLLTYGSDEEYLASASPFFAEGMGRSECLLAVTTEDQIGLLRDSLADRAGDVEYADSADWYRSPRTAMDGYRTFVNEKLEEGATWIRVVAEIDPESRSADRIDSWNRYESFVNVAFASAPTTFLCTYDDRSWPEGVIDHARQTHPVVASGNDMTPNPEYRGSEDLLIDAPLASGSPTAHH